jgi:hypothetical protein
MLRKSLCFYALLLIVAFVMFDSEASYVVFDKSILINAPGRTPYTVVVRSIACTYESTWGPPQYWPVRTSTNLPVNYYTVLFVLDTRNGSVSWGDITGPQQVDLDAQYQTYYPFLVGRGGGASVKYNCFAFTAGYHNVNISNGDFFSFCYCGDFYEAFPSSTADSAAHEVVSWLLVFSAGHASANVWIEWFIPPPPWPPIPYYCCTGKFDYYGTYTMDFGLLHNICPGNDVYMHRR